MNIATRNDAKVWLAAWGSNLRHGILRAALDGLTGCIALSTEGSNQWFGYIEARGELRTAYVRMTGKAYI